MSYDLYIKDPETGEVLRSDEPHDIAGGTYAMGGTTCAEFNVTYNYAPHFYRVLGEKGIRAVYGMNARESVAMLKSAADALSGERDSNYWQASEGNAKAALLDMMRLAEMFPDGVWDGD